MTAKPELEGENGVFALENAKKLSETAPARLACSDAEKNAANFLHETLAPYCDEVHEEIFNAHPSSGAFIYKAVCIMLTVSAVLFKCSEILGSAVWACIASPLSLAAFAIFAHKFFFDGTAADRFFLKKQSRNLIFKRLPRGTTLTRVVITADLDLPRHRRSIKLGKNTAYLLVACSVLCNTFTFCVCNAWLLCGAPEDSAVFSFLSSLCVLLCVFYILSLLRSLHPYRYMERDTGHRQFEPGLLLLCPYQSRYKYEVFQPIQSTPFLAIFVLVLIRLSFSVFYCLSPLRRPYFIAN